MARPYQVVVLGSSGFTGKLVCEHLANDYKGQVRWAMAGRSQEKLQSVRDELTKIDPACKDLEMIVADSSQQEAMEKLAASTDVVITTVGPYARLGLPLVKACAKHGTHYCDLTGEATFVRESMRTCDEAAKASGAKLLHCCGFDSIPSDMSTLLAVDHMKTVEGKGTALVEALHTGKGGVSGGTIQSGIELLQSDPEVLSAIGTPYALDPPGSKYDTPKGGPDASPSGKPVYSKAAESWTAPFIMASINEQVVRRSNACLGYVYGSTFQYHEYSPAASYFKALGGSALMLGLGATLLAASKFPWLRSKLPMSGDGPSKEVQTTGWFKVQAYALSEEADDAKPTRVLAVLEDPNRDGGYWSTSRMLLESALCLALDQDKLKKDPYASKNPAGVLTPASALGLVLRDRLKNAGFNLDVKTLPSE